MVFQAEVHLRDDISEKLTQRRQYRRSRRARKTRYREARYDNRRRPLGWLPPSLHSKAEATVKAVRFMASFLPVGRVRVEVVSNLEPSLSPLPKPADLSLEQAEYFGLKSAQSS